MLTPRLLGAIAASLIFATLAPAQLAPPHQESVAEIGLAPFKAPATADFTPGSSFTMEGWFYLTGNTPFGWLMGKGLATAGTDPFLSFGVFLDNAGTKLTFNASTGAPGSARNVTSPNVIPLRTWTHVAAVLDGSTLRLHLNGAIVATTTALGPPVAAPTVPLGIGIAYQASGATNFASFPGLARQVRFWNVARTAAQISAALSESLPTDRAGLVAAWPLDESGGSTARDLSGAGRALTTAEVIGRAPILLAVGPFYVAGATTPSAYAPIALATNSTLIDFDSDGDDDLIILQTAVATIPRDASSVAGLPQQCRDVCRRDRRRAGERHDGRTPPRPRRRLQPRRLTGSFRRRPRHRPPALAGGAV